MKVLSVVRDCFRYGLLGGAVCGVLCVVAALPGCVSRNIPEVAEGSHVGPPLTLDASGANYVVMLEAPSAGYGLTVDRVLERAGGSDIFATVRTPDPKYVHAQMIVTLRAAVPLATSSPARLCVRVLGADEEGERDGYRVVTTSAGR
jgi:hypothetical protein